MATLNAKITDEDLEYGSAQIEFFQNDLAGFKAQLQRHYDPQLKGRTNKSKKVNALLAMFAAHSEEVIKKRILDECAFSSLWLGSCYFHYATYRALALLSFPLVYELLKLATSYGDNFFTPESLSAQLTIPFESEATKADKVYKALNLMEVTGIVKKLKRGLFKVQKLPLLDAQGIEAILLAAAELNEGTADSVNAVLNGLSFEITHEFYDYYGNIPYDKIIPAKVLASFKESSAQYTIQYKNGSWVVSDEEYLYQPTNEPRAAFYPKFYITVEQVKAAKMRKNNFEEHKSLNSHGKNV